MCLYVSLPGEYTKQICKPMIPVFSALKNFAGLLRDALREFRRHGPLQIAGAASFFAVFALPAMLVILPEALSMFGSPLSIRDGLLRQLSLTVDSKTIGQVSHTVSKVWWLPLGAVTQGLGFFFLLFVATTFFAVIKSSLNQLWGVRLKENNGFFFLLGQRIKFLGAILLAGMLVFATLAIGEKVDLPGGHLLFKRLVYYGSAMLESVTWFILVFRFLADGRPGWKAAVAGGVFAGVLFTLGKSALRLLLSYNAVHSIYGASSAMVILLLFVFYSSLIFYYSACFVRVFSVQLNTPIRPTVHAIT